MDADRKRPRPSSCPGAGVVQRPRVSPSQAPSIRCSNGSFESGPEAKTERPRERDYSGLLRPAATSRDEARASTVHVSGYHKDVTLDDLRELFTEHSFNVQDISLPERLGKPKGYAFVRLRDAEEVNIAIGSLNGIPWHGGTLKLNAQKTAGDKAQAPTDAARASTVFVHGLSWDGTEDNLRDLFEDKGFNVQHINTPLNPRNGKPKGFAFVELYDAEEVQVAIESLNGIEWYGRALTLRPTPTTGGGDAGKSKKPHHD